MSDIISYVGIGTVRGCCEQDKVLFVELNKEKAEELLKIAKVSNDYSTVDDFEIQEWKIGSLE